MLNQEERELKIQQATEAYVKFMDVILPGWEKDPGLIETPKRVSKMYINEHLNGLYGEKPKITVFKNESKYSGIIFQGDIEIHSMCEHHFMPFFGRAYVAYLPNPEGSFIGLSKLNRVVEYYARRPQVQEKLTQEIFNEINELIPDNLGIAVLLSCNHTCVSCRGSLNDSTMKTALVSGKFFDNSVGSRDEFYRMVSDLKK